MLPSAQKEKSMPLLNTDHGKTVCGRQNPSPFENCFGIYFKRMSTVTSSSVRTWSFAKELNIERQDTDVLMASDRMLAATKAKKEIQDSPHAARMRTKRTPSLSCRFLCGWGGVMVDGVKSVAKTPEDVECGAVLADKYRVTEGGTDDEPSLRHAVHISSGSKVFLRFRTHAPLPGTEEIDGASTPPASVCRWIETVEDATWSPPFTVFERGDGTFDQWLARPDKSCEEKKSALYKILEALADLHARGRAIGSPLPNRIVWFARENSWKLLDLRPTESRRSRRRPPSPADTRMRNAPPELVLYDRRRDSTAVPRPSSDMWSFGAMVLEAILPGQSLCYPDACPGVDGRVALARQITLRLASVPGEHAYTLLRNLLQIDPIKRCTASQALRSAFFRAPDRPHTTDTPQNEIRRLLCSGVVDTARQSSYERLSHTAKTAVSVEVFRRRSTSSDPFHLRPGREAYAVSDAILPQQPIFLLTAGQNFRIRIRQTQNASPAPAPRRVRAVYARVDEGEYVELDTEMALGSRKTLEVVALVEPARLQSPRLLVCSPSDEGLLRQRLVKLDVLMDGALTGDQERLEERQHVIHCKILPPGSRMRVQRLRKECSDAWHACRRRREA